MGSIPFHLTGEALRQRMERAVEKIEERLQLTTRTLDRARIPHAIIGGHAVRAWVAQADEAAVRITCDVDILLRREDWSSVRLAMEAAGFVYRHVYRQVAGSEMFLDTAESKLRDAVHVFFAGERVRPDHLLPAPDISEIVSIQDHPVLILESLVQMKLVSFRIKDRMHLRDMIDVELIDASWCDRLPPELAARLQELLDDPNG